MQLIEYEDMLDDMLEEYSDLKIIENKIRSVQATLKAFKEYRLPQHPLENLELDVNYVYQHIDKYPNIINFSTKIEELRQIVIENFGIWHIFSQDWITDLQQFCGENTTNLELMAGNGLIGANLRNTIVTDNLNWDGQDVTSPKPWCEIEQLDAMEAVKKYISQVDNIILSWSPDGLGIDYNILNYLRENGFTGKFIVIGEKRGATNSALFWREAHLQAPELLNRNHHAFDFIHDRVYLAK